MKLTKQDRFHPGFLHPPDKDGFCRAQEVTHDGYVSNDKFDVYIFENDVSESKKHASQKRKVKHLNDKFGFSFK